MALGFLMHNYVTWIAAGYIVSCCLWICLLSASCERLSRSPTPAKAMGQCIPSPLHLGD